jgi:hypothetical protein
MKITLAPGEKLHIVFAETDGGFVIHLDTKEFPNAVVVEETADCKPSLVGTTGIIYHDACVSPSDSLEDKDVDCLRSGVAPDPDVPVGFFLDSRNVVQCTALVRCEVLVNARGSKYVETLNAENEVTSIYAFYESVADLEAERGIEVDLLIIP